MFKLKGFEGKIFTHHGIFFLQRCGLASHRDTGYFFFKICPMTEQPNTLQHVEGKFEWRLGKKVRFIKSTFDEIID